jgi:hypothetical protein
MIQYNYLLKKDGVNELYTIKKAVKNRITEWLAVSLICASKERTCLCKNNIL